MCDKIIILEKEYAVNFPKKFRTKNGK